MGARRGPPWVACDRSGTRRRPRPAPSGRRAPAPGPGRAPCGVRRVFAVLWPKTGARGLLSTDAPRPGGGRRRVPHELRHPPRPAPPGPGGAGARAAPRERGGRAATGPARALDGAWGAARGSGAAGGRSGGWNGSISTGGAPPRAGSAPSPRAVCAPVFAPRSAQTKRGPKGEQTTTGEYCDLRSGRSAATRAQRANSTLPRVESGSEAFQRAIATFGLAVPDMWPWCALLLRPKNEWRLWVRRKHTSSAIYRGTPVPSPAPAALPRCECAAHAGAPLRATPVAGGARCGAPDAGRPQRGARSGGPYPRRAAAPAAPAVPAARARVGTGAQTKFTDLSIFSPIYR